MLTLSKTSTCSSNETEAALGALGCGDVKDKKEVVPAAQALVTDIGTLLDLLVVQRKEADKYQDALIGVAESINKRVERLVVVARKIPGAGELELDESLSSATAENQEMLNAAAQIQAAARHVERNASGCG